MERFFSGRRDITDLLQDKETEGISVIEIGLRETDKGKQIYKRKKMFSTAGHNYLINFYAIFLEGNGKGTNGYIAIKTQPPTGKFPIRRGSKNCREFLQLPRQRQGIIFEDYIKCMIEELANAINAEYGTELILYFPNVCYKNKTHNVELDVLLLFKWKLVMWLFKYRLKEQLTNGVSSSQLYR
ncbi:hypothetical protein DRZ77_02955 [Candidatus Woesearchaeota archaeon]|nr:hypothetical protein [Candidatus Woesearchaeota archaeon]RLE40136.1 MAG: hypothetical protein DRZ77_02955 [Candidatus Woesearchaeota archaeon]